MHFKLKARINHSDARTIQKTLDKLAAKGDVKKVGNEFAAYVEIEGNSAEELNKVLLSALKSVRKRTKIRAEWTSDDGITQTYFDDLLILENFKFFALQYLNDWYEKDRGFIAELSSTTSTREVRLRCLEEAAQYYGVLRNFGGVAEKGMDAALTMLGNAAQTVTLQNVVPVVSTLATDFESAYPREDGKEKVSAASKFLWLRCQSPIVIRDTNAFACLRAASCGRLPESDYAAYSGEWRRQFSKRKARIRAACAELVRVKEFSLAKDMSDEELKSIVGSRWFHERVFDKFLWWNGERILRSQKLLRVEKREKRSIGFGSATIGERQV